MSRYAGSFGLSTFFLLAVCIVAIIVVISTFRALCFIFSGQNDRMQRAKQMLRVSTRRTLISVVAVSATGLLWSDGQDIRTRSFIRPIDCTVERSPDKSYVVRSCYAGEKRMIRVYDRNGSRLLAERTYVDLSDDPVIAAIPGERQSRHDKTSALALRPLHGETALKHA
ncbi:hypothetical protein GXB81_18990 [Paraburkholderia sp. Ac-20336]|uniref:hypothetical protein n=1 Tax=Paraburkholderia sp. Ac-20336 TaxID=2703886 RepID=UPI00197F4BD5|nr:hypothetical protein [Paraburkholderia sp. Ac-20336]MBN3805120.1 hypothetical protein [Paraburkholderia sp. Ac-20336]